MKYIKAIALSLILLISAAQLIGYEGATSIEQVAAIRNTPQRIILRERFKAPITGTYIISFNANAFNLRVHPSTVTIQAFVNGEPSNFVMATVPVPGRQTIPIQHIGTLNLNEGDVVDFRFQSPHTHITLRPVNNSPSFKVTIQPPKSSTKL